MISRAARYLLMCRSRRRRALAAIMVLFDDVSQCVDAKLDH